MELPVFKIRASAAHEILAGSIGLTEIQSARMEELQSRADGAGKPLTPNMVEELSKLKHRHENPELPTGAKSYCEKWLKEKLYERRKNFANQYLEKGIACEEDSITYAAECLGWGEVSKNEEWFSDEYMEGTPDLILELCFPNSENAVPTVIDMKNVWDCFTMPLFEDALTNESYRTQLQVYMHLVSQAYKVDFNDALLCYALMSAPLHVMEKQMRSLSWEEGHQGFITDEIRQKVHREMNYDYYPPELRLKVYHLKRDPSIIEEIINRVKLCRDYIPMLLKKKELIKSA